MKYTGVQVLGGFKKNDYAGMVGKGKGLKDPHVIAASTDVTGGPKTSASGGPHYPK